MNKRIEKKLSKNIKLKRKAFRSGVRIPLTRPEKKLARLHKDIFMSGIAEALRDCHGTTKNMGVSLELFDGVVNAMTKEETWEERINRINSYKFANHTPIKVHKSPTVWDKIKAKLKGWLK